MSSLSTSMRRKLEGTVKQARTIAEAGARHALEALAVHESDPYKHMDEAQRALRRNLRSQAKQLGDGESKTKRGAYEIKHLAEKIAYDQWHRLLFARYLLENNLLISPDHGVSVSLDDCEELSLSMGLKDAWVVAARFAAKELPEIFLADDPTGAVELSVNDRKPLIALVTSLSTEVFTATDSLGWCYQFWQAEKKDEVNAVGNKIGAEELPSVTQLFTEDYMVDFLLDNTIGAWHAAKFLTAQASLNASAKTESELRNAVALPGCPWNYLRFVRGQDGKWTPAAGTFDGWPETAQELTCLDPCMGSGHFVVAMFERLVALRIAEEGLDPGAAVAAVLRDNLFGLEIDSRCTQIGAFNLALAAWRRIGHCTLPPMNLACSGAAPNSREADWLALAGDNDKLKRGMARLYEFFKDAPILGSLINPRQNADDIYVADYHELHPLLERRLAQEVKDDTAHEMAVAARGLAKAADILAMHFTLVATNVPYLGRGKQDEVLQKYCARVHPRAKADLATCFVERCLSYCSTAGTTALVTSQNWWFATGYAGFRKYILGNYRIGFAASLGEEAWHAFGDRGPMAALMLLDNSRPAESHKVRGIDARAHQAIADKMVELLSGDVMSLAQAEQLRNQDSRIILDSGKHARPLSEHAISVEGMSTGDGERFLRVFWEVPELTRAWEAFQRSPADCASYSGAYAIVKWEDGRGDLATSTEARIQGHGAWERRGVVVNMMRHLNVSLSAGAKHDKITAVIVPKVDALLPALWAFCSDESFFGEVRRLNPGVQPGTGTLVKVPFDLVHWQEIAAERFPHGLPKPFSSDPTQWLFNGHPAGADQPLHVATARLLGYQWPRQTGSSFSDCPALPLDGLEVFADSDGIVCLSAARGEAPAAERLRALLAQALGHCDVSALLASAGPASKGGSKSETLEEWLREEFFEQHCAIFHHRPFIWHLWDGHKSGFSALVNAHRLDHAMLEKLTYAYLGDWIRRQQAAVDAGEAGSDGRLAAAKQLQARLKLILEGEPPFDLFIRWKPLSEQAIGWHPDLNDGVRMNIRPFLAQDIPGGKRGAGVLRAKPNIKWDKDRGKEPVRDKKEFPWFWGWDEAKMDFAGIGNVPDGNRWNGCHYTTEFKRKARQ